MGVEYVIESTGLTVKDEAAAHLKGGAKKVIITDISKDVPMFVFGVNEMDYKPDQDDIVSSASFITHQLAPILEVFHFWFGILEGDMKILDSAIATQDDDGPIMTDSRDRRLAFFHQAIGATGAAVKVLQFLHNSLGFFRDLMPALQTTSDVIAAVKAAEELFLNVGDMLGIDDGLKTTLMKLLSNPAAMDTIDGPHGTSSPGSIPADVEAVGKVLAYLCDKLTGTVTHGPTRDRSIVVLTVRLEVEATLEYIKAAIK
ncbi:hypothetical protein SLEP1_g58450 [Rubroshorea leprosula]|uniref:glyceraldehyde-3-phosphate dehydrogenase (phosphorylating) n=1 Tax=Rubroshorea leprosula TaxID=152421 RepID=A0AAV5MPG0_9ROSI|nr:hypothetical protein SLEP1_g58450 [Rubroshorea leprosula]